MNHDRILIVGLPGRSGSGQSSAPGRARPASDRTRTRLECRRDRRLPARQRRPCPAGPGPGGRYGRPWDPDPRQRLLDHRGHLLAGIDLHQLWGTVGPCLALPRTELHQLLREGVPVGQGLVYAYADVTADSVGRRPDRAPAPAVRRLRRPGPRAAEAARRPEPGVRRPDRAGPRRGLGPRRRAAGWRRRHGHRRGGRLRRPSEPAHGLGPHPDPTAATGPATSHQPSATSPYGLRTTDLPVQLPTPARSDLGA
jgi:hypothetical protein